MKDSFASVSASRWLASLALAAGTMLGSPASASCPPDESESTRMQPARARVANMGLAGRGVEICLEDPSRMIVVMTSETDGTEYSVRIEDDKVSATIDGKAVPEPRVRKRDGAVEILDDDGKVLQEFTLPNFDGAVGGFGGVRLGNTLAPRLSANQLGGLRFEPMEGIELDDDAASVLLTNPPPVMLGITMSESGEDGGVVVDKVIDGLPAAKAGLRAGDRILALSGAVVRDTGSLRGMLREQKAGEAIVVRLSRDGKEEEVKVTLEAFDANRLALTEAREAAKSRINHAQERDEAWYKDAQRAIEEARQTIRESKATTEARKAAEETLAKALASLARAKQAAQSELASAEDGTRDAVNQWLKGQNRLIEPGKAEVFVSPNQGRGAVATARSGDREDRFERLNERLDRMLAMLEDQKAQMRDAEARVADLRKENADLKDRLSELQKKSESEKKRGGN